MHTHFKPRRLICIYIYKTLRTVTFPITIINNITQFLIVFLITQFFLLTHITSLPSFLADKPRFLPKNNTLFAVILGL